MELTNKEKVKSFIEAVNNRDTTTVKQLVYPDYIQHNRFIPTGRTIFLSLFPVWGANNTQAETIRMLADGNFVVMHNLWKNTQLFGTAQMVSFDILRIAENGLIAEKWDAMMPKKGPNPSGKTLIDGSTSMEDLDKSALIRRKS